MLIFKCYQHGHLLLLLHNMKTVLRAPHQILYQRGKGNMRSTNDPPCEKNNQT